MPDYTRKNQALPVPKPRGGGPSTLQRLLAGGTRVGAGIFSAEGGLPGAGISGLGEGIAEIIEGDTPSLARMGVEAGIGAIPMASVIKFGKPAASAVRSGLLSGTGEGMREIAKGEEISPGTIAKSGLLGALTGGFFGKFFHGTPPVPEAPPTGPAAPFDPTKPTANLFNPRTDKIVARTNVPTAPKLPTLESPKNLAETLGVETERRVGGALKKSTVGPKNVQDIDKGIAGAGRTGQRIRQEVLEEIPDVEKAHDQANKILEAEQAAEKFKLAKTGLEPQEPTVSESLSAKTGPGTRGRVTTKYTQPEEDNGAGDLFDIVDTPPTAARPLPAPETVTVKSGRVTKKIEIPPKGTPQREIYEKWISLGRDPETATDLAIKGLEPRPSASILPAVEKTPGSLSEALGVPPARGTAPTPETPVTAPPEAPQGLSTSDKDLLRQAGFDENAIAAMEKEAGIQPETPPEPTIPGRGGVAVEEPPSRVSQKTMLPGQQARQDRFEQDIIDRYGEDESQWPDFLREKGTFKEQGPIHWGTPPETPPPTEPLPSNLILGEEGPYSEGRGLGEAEPTPESPLAKLFGSRVSAAGENYRDIKKAIGLGETKLTEPTGLLDSRGRPRTASNLAGAALSREAKAAGLPSNRPVKATPPPPTEPIIPGRGGVATEEPPLGGPPAAPGVSQTQKARDAALAKRKAAQEAKQQELPGIDATTESQVNQAQQIADEVREAGGTAEDIRKAIIKRLSSEGGSVSPDVLARIGLGATGAFFGGIAGGSVGHPFLGAAAGAGIGLLGPDAIAAGLKQIGTSPEVAEAAKEAAQSPEGVRTIAQKIYATLPQVQRFNLLADGFGLPANAFFGPYGSAMMAGLEAHLTGDPRGMQVLRTLTPERFMKEFRASTEEAGRLIREGEIGRAETAVLGSGKGSQLLQFPGQMMTAGDVAARKILEEAGFSGEEARRITMTSEPEMSATKTLANMSKRSVLMQMLQPFARTPANIAEQGAMRIPGLGSAVQYIGRENPDPFKTQMIQQGLGLATGGAGYLAGENLDPEQAKVARRYLTNLGGQYSLPVGIGFAMGQAARDKKQVVSTQSLANLFNALPLPSSAALTSWGASATTGAVPRGALPTVAIDALYPDRTPAAKPLTRSARYSRRRP